MADYLERIGQDFTFATVGASVAAAGFWIVFDLRGFGIPDAFCLRFELEIRRRDGFGFGSCTAGIDGGLTSRGGSRPSPGSRRSVSDHCPARLEDAEWRW